MSTDVSTNATGASPVRLGPVSCLVLGLIGLRGPSTPYDLKKAVGRSVSYFWPFPHSQLYGEPERLVNAGLLSRQDEAGGRRRKLYTLTDTGRAALTNWLSTPPDDVYEMRDMAVLQLFFSEFMSTEDLVALANTQAELYRARLAVYEDIEKAYAERPGLDRRMAPLKLGIRLATVCQAFWEEIAQDPPSR